MIKDDEEDDRWVNRGLFGSSCGRSAGLRRSNRSSERLTGQQHETTAPQGARGALVLSDQGGTALTRDPGTQENALLCQPFDW